MKTFLSFWALFWVVFTANATDYTHFVNPFIGTNNFGATNPGAVCPNGMISVVPFNVMGSNDNKYDKDKRWWSTPYTNENVFFTGYAHGSLSGVGCPDMSSLLLMPTNGDLVVDYAQYGSRYTDEKASPGYYTNRLTKYGIKTEVSATLRSGISRFTFPAGQANILLNLGEGLTNENGAWLKTVSETEIEGMKLLGGFCYETETAFPIYFVMRVSKAPREYGYWKKQREMPVEKAWDKYSGKYKCYQKYKRDMVGDDIGAYFCYDVAENERIEVQIGISFVSTENARENLDEEQPICNLDSTRALARSNWNKALSKVEVEGEDDNEKTIFYTALYHTLIHPNILNDVNGEYPMMQHNGIGKTNGTRYTVFSLWDTYRNLHQLLTLLYPQKQLDMVRSMVAMYKESGWLPKWELYGQETLTMEGDPSFPVIVDSWAKGLRDFDINTAYEAMYKSATTQSSRNFIRPDNSDYLQLGYVPIKAPFDNSVSHALEYYIADNALSKLAEMLGKKDDAIRFRQQSMNYKTYFSTSDGTFRPKKLDGTFYTPFDPTLGTDFEPNPGFHEGSAWNYTFMIPFDMRGVIKMHGKKRFLQRLQEVFAKGYYDPTNEPNLSYPYLFNYVKGEEWRTQKYVAELLKRHFSNNPDGLPGNDDAGTMSAWAVFGMLGLYPDDPTTPRYALTLPAFDSIILHLDEKQYKGKKITITKQKSTHSNGVIKRIYVDGKRHNNYFISHEQLVNTNTILFEY